MTARETVLAAYKNGLAVPAFNIPYLPMMAPVVRALRDTNCIGQIAVARLEWVKFKSGSPRAIREQYETVKDVNYSLLHLDHVPVIDEDNLRVDYLPIIKDAVELGYQSVMIDGSRLPLAENIAVTKEVVKLAHARGVAVEAELGAVLGHESGPLPPYEELFASGKGFTDPGEAMRFVKETGVDWLSVAVGSIHGAISEATRGRPKPAARLNIEHLAKLREATGIPLVLHGGTGIPNDMVQAGIRNGIAKINIATAIRQPYEAAVNRSPEEAAEAVYQAACVVIREDLALEGTASKLQPSMRHA